MDGAVDDTPLPDPSDPAPFAKAIADLVSKQFEQSGPADGAQETLDVDESDVVDDPQEDERREELARALDRIVPDDFTKEPTKTFEIDDADVVENQPVDPWREPTQAGAESSEWMVSTAVAGTDGQPASLDESDPDIEISVQDVDDSTDTQRELIDDPLGSAQPPEVKPSDLVEAVGGVRRISEPAPALEPETSEFEPIEVEAIPSRIGRFELVRRIGAFAEGELWRATEVNDDGAQRECVLKILSEELAPAGSMRRQRFLAEARLGRLLAHPHIVETFDAGESDGVPYLAREYVDGVSLATLMDADPDGLTSLPLAIELGQVVAEALAYVQRRTHNGGKPLYLVHGEISPSAILVEKAGSPKLTDLGLCHLDDTTLDPKHDARQGKLGYQAPEQARGRSLDSRSDMFSLGIVLVELLSGRPMARRGELRLRELADDVVARCSARDDIPARLTALLVRMTALAPASRPATAGEVADSLRAMVPADQNYERCLETELGQAIASLTVRDHSGVEPVPIPVVSRRDSERPASAPAGVPIVRGDPCTYSGE